MPNIKFALIVLDDAFGSTTADVYAVDVGGSSFCRHS